MGIPNMHTTYNYAEMINSQANMVNPIVNQSNAKPMCVVDNTHKGYQKSLFKKRTTRK